MNFPSLSPSSGTPHMAQGAAGVWGHGPIPLCLLHLAQSQGSDLTRRMIYLEALSPASEGGSWANSGDS